LIRDRGDLCRLAAVVGDLELGVDLEVDVRKRSPSVSCSSPNGIEEDVGVFGRRRRLGGSRVGRT